MSDDDTLTKYLWPIVAEMIKTAIENKQNSEDYLMKIRYYCLVMSKGYINQHFSDIKEHADEIDLY